MAYTLEEGPALSAWDQRIYYYQFVDTILAMREYLRMKEGRGGCSTERTRNFEKGITVPGSVRS